MEDLDVTAYCVPNPTASPKPNCRAAVGAHYHLAFEVRKCNFSVRAL